MLIKNILLIGCGMIGGSFALAIKKSLPSINIIGFDKHKKNINLAQKLGIINSATNDLNKAIDKVELIVIASPLNSYVQIFSKINDSSHQPLITDVGSAKTFVIEQAQKYLKNPAKFIPAHPIAGREKTGPKFADSELFNNHFLIITPLPENKKSDINVIKKLWRTTNAKIEVMSAEKHDEVCAGISHLPHLLSMALVHYLLQKPDTEYFLKFAAGGFRDFTRIAASDPQMWHDVFLANKKFLLDNLSQLENSLKAFRKMIMNGKDIDHQQKLFSELTKIGYKRKNWKAKA